ncbi:MAG: ROK family protein [Helicobacteraceae bacterium]
MGLRLGIDIGGTNTKLAAFDNLTPVKTRVYKSNLDRLEWQINDFLSGGSGAGSSGGSNTAAGGSGARSDAAGGAGSNTGAGAAADYEFFGFSFAGHVENNTIGANQNVSGTALVGLDLARWSLERFGVAGAADNDLKCAALAEQRSTGLENLGVIYIGTGFGSAFFSGKDLVRGAHNYAGEIGHIPFRPAPFECGCGARSCLELYASGSGLRKWCAHLGRGKPNLQDLRANADTAMIYENFIAAFKHGILSFNALYNPARIVLGGGVVRTNPFLVELANEALSRDGSKRARGKIAVLSRLDEFAPSLGAALLKDLTC